MTSSARFWEVDFHVHTPGSQDAKAEHYGSAAEIVAAAVAAGLDAIAITDHNTASWCDEIAAAAATTELVVLPGVEISTTEGHLLAIWEAGTPSESINELLARLSIGRQDRGKLDIAARVGLAEAAKEVAEAGGIAIAAHIDKPRGLLELKVKAHLKRTLLDEHISGVEIVHVDAINQVEAKIEDERVMAYVRGSDTWNPALSAHALSGIGARRTWIKASKPDLVGIRHALADPQLRIALDAPQVPVSYSTIERIEISGGFLDGQTINLCPDLNCLLGGTGAGKSLILEATRFALMQQVDGAAFAAIRKEVDSRLLGALKVNSVVRLLVRVDGRQYRVERVLAEHSEPSSVWQQTGADWVEVDVDPTTLVPLAGFSQGEILEYSREPVGRMSLIDSGIDLTELEAQIEELVGEIGDNSIAFVEARDRVATLRVEAAREDALQEQVRQISPLFDDQLVKQQGGWKREGTALLKVQKALTSAQVPSVALPAAELTHVVPDNEAVFVEVKTTVTNLKSTVAAATAMIDKAIEDAIRAVGESKKGWDTSFSQFTDALDAKLKEVDPDSTLTSLRAHLETLQGKLTQATADKEELQNQALPALAVVSAERERLLQLLHKARVARRELRRARVAELNAKTAGFVKLDVPNNGDFSEFRAALEGFKVGSRVGGPVLDAVARTVHPLKFGRAMWDGRPTDLVNPDVSIDAQSIARLYANIDERGLWEQLLDLQMIDRPDVLTIKFKKPDDGTYAEIEALAHGQRCTAILVILLADGTTPVLVDQPEDALHAPWIEQYLVDRLRKLRGSRQYIFATRSPGIVVSADAEQIVTMKATAGKGEVEASGSLERHDLNALVLHHLEGGPIPFSRRTQKLIASVNK